MAAQDPLSFRSNGYKRRRIKNKFQQISNPFSSFSPPLLFEDDTFSPITTSVNVLRHERSGDQSPRQIRSFGKKSRKYAVFSRLNAVEDENFNSIMMSDHDLYDTPDNDALLSFLPGKGSNLPPKTMEILAQLTRMYLNRSISREQKVSEVYNEILNAIEDEHRSISIAFTINGKEYFDEIACKILSFAVLHKLPFEIISQLWDRPPSVINSESSSSHIQTKEILSNLSSYRTLKFSTRKLPMRLRSKHTPKFISLQREFAVHSVYGASRVKAPQKRPTAEDLLDSIEQLSSTVPQSSLFKSFALRKRFEDLQFFPIQKDKWMKQWTPIVQKQTQKLKSAGRAGLISYGMLNAAWYSFAMVLSWKQISVASYTGALESPFQISLWKFSRVLTYVYVGSQLTKLPRIILAAIMAPFGERVLRFFERRLNVGSTTAFSIAAGLMIGSCFSVWAGIIFFDAFLSSGGSFFM